MKGDNHHNGWKCRDAGMDGANPSSFFQTENRDIKTGVTAVFILTLAQPYPCLPHL
jgi:hypothetical protein